jgi:predicted GIY-YIG superfamily endonuclease
MSITTNLLDIFLNMGYIIKMQYIESVVSDEIINLPEKFKQQNGEYICYILRSVTAPLRTYAGSTNNIIRRLRQHNGIIKGGAYATKTSKPWRICMLISGFKDRKTALRFEWFTKVGHAPENILKLCENSLDRRACLILNAERKIEHTKIEYYIPDKTMGEYINRTKTRGIPGTLDSFIISKIVPQQPHEFPPSTKENHNM